MTRPSRNSDAALQSLSVLVANWETPDLTIRCVRALRDDGVPPDRFAVVDNGSRDGSYERLVTELAPVRVIRLDENIGFARAMNHAAETLPGEHYLIMNNDAFLHRPGSVHTMLERLEDPRIGVVAPRLLNPDLTLQRSVRPLDFPTVVIFRATGLSRFMPNEWQPYLGHHWDHERSRAVPCVDGPVLLVRGTFWHDLGGFNEGTVMHGDDTDLCWEARARRLVVWFERNAEFVHLGDASAGRHWDNPERSRLIGIAEGGILRQHLPLARGALSIAGESIALAARAAVWRATGNHARSRAALTRIDGYTRGFTSSSRNRARSRTGRQG